MALHLPTGPLKTCSGLDVNSAHGSPLADDLATVPSGPVNNKKKEKRKKKRLSLTTLGLSRYHYTNAVPINHT